LIITCGL